MFINGSLELLLTVTFQLRQRIGLAYSGKRHNRSFLS